MCKEYCRKYERQFRQVLPECQFKGKKCKIQNLIRKVRIASVGTTKDPTELLKMVLALQSDLQSKDSTTPEMLVALKSIEKQYVKEVQAKNK